MDAKRVVGAFLRGVGTFVSVLTLYCVSEGALGKDMTIMIMVAVISVGIICTLESGRLNG